MSISHGRLVIKILPMKIIILILVCLFSWGGHARNTTFWKKRTATQSIQFTTMAQSILNQACSGMTTVEARVGGNASPVPVDLTVNLVGPAGIVFYSDADCMNTISSLVITNGTSSKSFYFTATNTGSPSLSASATNYTTGAQTQTIGSNPFIWMGGGGNANWDTGANWSGGSAPGSNKQAVFSSACASNCSPTLNVPINIDSIRMWPGYSGSINQGPDSISAGYIIQQAGTFNGGTGAINFMSVLLNGGTFRSTSGNLTYNYGFTVLGTTTFNHNNGTVTSYSPNWALTIMSPGSAVFNNVVMSTSGWGQNALDGTTMTVAGNLTLVGTGYDISNGTFAVAGNVTATNGGVYGGIRVKLTGNASGQTITGTGPDTFPSIEIATGTNPVTLSGTVNVVGDFTITSVGTLTTTGSTLQLSCGLYQDCFAEFNSKHINNLTISPNGYGQTFFTNAGAIVDGNLVVSSGGYGTHGAVSVYGDVSFTSPGSGGGMSLTLLGSNSSLSVASSTTVPGGTVTVSKIAGQTLTLATDVSWSDGGQSLNVTEGTIDMAGHSLTVAGSVTLNGKTITKSGGTLSVGGSPVGSGSLLGGTVNP